MPTRRALSLLDLVGAPGGAQALIPDRIASKLEGLGVIDYSSTTSDGAYIHHGTIQALADALPSLDEGWIVRAPGRHLRQHGGIRDEPARGRRRQRDPLPADPPTSFVPTLVAYRAFVNWPGTPPASRARRAAVLDSQVAIIGRMHQVGVRLLTGTDFTNPDSGGVRPADLHDELDYFVRAGLTPTAALA